MFQEFLLFFGSGLFLLYLLKSFLTGGKSKWKAMGFEVIETKFNITDRLLQKISMEEVDQDIYTQIKEKNLDLGVFVDFRQAVVFISNPELIKKIAIKDFDSFTDRRKIMSKAADPILEKMLFNSNGSEWKEMRGLLSPTFTTGKIRRMFDIFNSCAVEVVKYIQNENSGEMIDTPDIMGRCTMDVIASAAFGVEANSIKDKNSIFSQMGKKMQRTSILTFVKIFFIFTLPKFLLELSRLSFLDTESKNFFIEALMKTIKQREETKEQRGDFLQIMIEAKEGKFEENKDELSQFEKEAQLTTKGKSNIKVTNDTIVAQAVSFLFGGFDTTESLMDFGLYELAVNPQIQEKLAKEVKKSYQAEGGKFTYESINKMDYLDRFISETLRKHSPAFRTERKCTEDYEVSEMNVVIPKGTVIAFPIYALQNDPQYWPNPSKFDPDRFLPEEKEKRHPYSYLPFGHGPRNCIGMRFALMEAKTVIAEIVRNFVIEPCAKTEIPIQHNVGSGGIKAKNGLFLTYKKRTN